MQQYQIHMLAAIFFRFLLVLIDFFKDFTEQSKTCGGVKRPNAWTDRIKTKGYNARNQQAKTHHRNWNHLMTGLENRNRCVWIRTAGTRERFNFLWCVVPQSLFREILVDCIFIFIAFFHKFSKIGAVRWIWSIAILIYEEGSSVKAYLSLPISYTFPISCELL